MPGVWGLAGCTLDRWEHSSTPPSQATLNYFSTYQNYNNIEVLSLPRCIFATETLYISGSIDWQPGVRRSSYFHIYGPCISSRLLNACASKMETRPTITRSDIPQMMPTWRLTYPLWLWITRSVSAVSAHGSLNLQKKIQVILYGGSRS